MEPRPLHGVFERIEHYVLGRTGTPERFGHRRTATRRQYQRPSAAGSVEHLPWNTTTGDVNPIQSCQVKYQDLRPGAYSAQHFQQSRGAFDQEWVADVVDLDSVGQGPGGRTSGTCPANCQPADGRAHQQQRRQRTAHSQSD
jgi:hypothetical protein